MRRWTLLLMEELAMTLVFALAAAICLRAFALADGISRRSALRDATAILHAGRNQWVLGTPREYLASPYGKRFGGDLS